MSVLAIASAAVLGGALPFRAQIRKAWLGLVEWGGRHGDVVKIGGPLALAVTIGGAVAFMGGGGMVVIGGGGGAAVAGGGGLAEPIFGDDAADTMILSEDFDGALYASMTAVVDSINAAGDPAHGWWPRCEQLTSGWPQCSDTVADFSGAGFWQVTAGRTGNAIRIAYDSSGNQDSHEWRTYPNQGSPSADSRTMNFVSFYVRLTELTTLDTVYSQSWSIKHAMLWHTTGGRIQVQPHSLNGTTCPSRPTNRATWWRVEDNQGVSGCSGTTVDSTAATTPIDLFGAGWVRHTIQYQSPTSSPGYDGTFRLWEDGVLIIDVSATSLGVTPAGADVWKAWSDSADHEDMNTNTGVAFLSMGGPRTTGAFSLYYDLDDYDWWIRPGA